MRRLIFVAGVLPLLLSGLAVADERVDEFARKSSPADEKSPAALSKYLAKGCKTDEEKARAIYVWITDKIAYDADGFFSGNKGPQAAEAVFAAKKGVCEGYANVFLDLAKRMNLNAVKLHGFVKGFGYQDGQKISKPNHAWNAVQIGKKWYLLDSTWGAGSLTDKKFQKKFNAHFFKTDPEEMIFTHLPVAKEWQLRKDPMPAKEFEKQITISPALFELGISPKNIRNALKDGNMKDVVKTLGFPGNSTKIVDAPINRFLKADSEYLFKVKSADFDKVFVVNNGKQHLLDADGEFFSGKVTATKGTLAIGGQSTARMDNRIHHILQYVVD